MKILFINKFFYIKGGAESVFFDTAHLLEKNGNKVMFFSMRHPKNAASKYEKYFISNIDYERASIFHKLYASMNILYSIETRVKLAALIKHERPDIAHLHNIYHQMSPSILHTLKKVAIPTVMTLHDYKLCCPSYSMLAGSEVCESCKDGKYYNCFLKKCFKNSRLKSLLVTVEMILHHRILHIYDKVDIFISPSIFLKNKIEAMGFKGKIIYLPNFIDTDSISPRFGIQENSVIYFGRLSAEKGLITLIDAMKDMKNALLKIVGDGPMKGLILKKLEKEGIKNVCYLGYKSGKDLYNEIGKSALAVMPSEWYENNPHSILEAFALGKPVIGSRIGGIPELVREGITGLLFEPHDTQDLRNKIECLLSDHDRMVSMGKNARDLVVKEYNAGNHYRRLMDVYCGVIGEDNRSVGESSP